MLYHKPFFPWFCLSCFLVFGLFIKFLLLSGLSWPIACFLSYAVDYLLCCVRWCLTPACFDHSVVTLFLHVTHTKTYFSNGHEINSNVVPTRVDFSFLEWWLAARIEEFKVMSTDYAHFFTFIHEYELDECVSYHCGPFFSAIYYFKILSLVFQIANILCIFAIPLTIHYSLTYERFKDCQGFYCLYNFRACLQYCHSSFLSTALLFSFVYTIIIQSSYNYFVL